MKFKMNKISLNESKTNLLITLFSIIIIFALLPVSILFQVILLIIEQFVLLIILDSILILLLLLISFYFVLRCFGSSVTINNDSILVTNMLFSKKEISYSEIDSVTTDHYSKGNQLLNELWGECIILTDKSDKELLKFTYNAIALNLINEKIEILNNVIENENNTSKELNNSEELNTSEELNNSIETTDTNENDSLNNQNDESLEKTTE